MSITHTNRQGKTYYLHQSVTKKGNPKYYFLLKDEGNLVDELPDGYEIYEAPNSQVFLRRTVPQKIRPDERHFVEATVRELAQIDYTIFDVKDDAIVVYVADQDIDLPMEAFRRLPSEEQTRARFECYLRYSPHMQFELVDAERRLFRCKRRGYFMQKDVIWLSGPEPLVPLVRRYAPHLGADSFYELY